MAVDRPMSARAEPALAAAASYNGQPVVSTQRGAVMASEWTGRRFNPVFTALI